MTTYLRLSFQGALSVVKEMERHVFTANYSEAYRRRPNPLSLKTKPNCELEALQVLHGSVSTDVSGDRTLKEQKVLERPPHPGLRFISRMFLVQKRSEGLRPIFYLRGLNKHVKVGKFRLISHLKVPDFLQNEDWMTRSDMSLAFLNVPIAKSYRCWYRGTN